MPFIYLYPSPLTIGYYTITQGNQLTIVIGSGEGYLFTNPFSPSSEGLGRSPFVSIFLPLHYLLQWLIDYPPHIILGEEEEEGGGDLGLAPPLPPPAAAAGSGRRDLRPCCRKYNPFKVIALKLTALLND